MYLDSRVDAQDSTLNPIWRNIPFQIHKKTQLSHLCDYHYIKARKETNYAKLILPYSAIVQVSLTRLYTLRIHQVNKIQCGADLLALDAQI